MSKRSALVSCAIVAVALGVAGFAWLFLREGPATAARSSDGGGRPSSAASVAAEGSPAAASSRTLTTERTDALAPEWNDAAHDVVGPVVEGTIVVIDPENVKHAGENGSFVPEFIDGVDSDLPDAERGRRRVAVKHGCFRFDARGATAMLAEELELGGRAAEVGRGLDLSTGRPLAIEARWIDDVLLHVLDATTRKELSGVRVCSRAFAPTAEHPGRPDPLSLFREGERSPFHLTRATAIERATIGGSIWVGARGHAWTREKIDFEREREHEVLLGPAGTLAVVVTEPPDAPPFDRRAPPRVRLRHPDHEAGEPICDVAAEAGEFELEGLEPGEVVAAIEVGDNFLMPVVLSRAAVTIRAGETARVALSLDPALAPKPTRLAGTAFVPEGWGEAYLEIRLYPLDLRGGTREDELRTCRIALEPIAGRPGWHAWSVSPILPSKYRLVVPCAALETKVDVPEEGRDDVTITIPEPAVLSVRVVDDATGHDVEVGMLWWSFTDTHNYETVPIRRSEAAGRCVGAVRPGRGRFDRSSFSTEFVVESNEEFTVHAGKNELVLHAHPPCGVELAIAGGDEALRTAIVTWSREEGTDRELMELDAIRASRGAHKIVLPGPGRYHFTLKHPSDAGEEFLFDVDVPKGEFVEKAITINR